MNIFKRDYTLRKGSTFSKIILLEDIYVTLNGAETYTVEGGMSLVADETVKFAIDGTLSELNTKLILLMSATATAAITDLGIYNYAIDIGLAGVVQTILEGSILVKDDVSKTI